MTNVWYNEDIHHLTHPCSVQCVFIYYITFYITYRNHQIIERSGLCHVRENRTYISGLSVVPALPGNRKWCSIKHSHCLLSTPPPPYAVWSGFNVLLSRGFQQNPNWNNIPSRNANTVNVSLSLLSQGGDDWGQMLELINTGGSEKIPDRWPHPVSPRAVK